MIYYGAVKYDLVL